MKVLITGREGQLVRSLLERGAERPSLELIAIGKPLLDLELPGSAAQAVRSIAPDVVISAAAYTAVDQAEDEPERAFRVNGEAPGELAATAHEVGARIIHISTDYVFDGAAEAPYREDGSTNPLGVYGRTKLAGEEAVRAAAVNHMIVRTAWVYSPFGRNFVKTMMRLAAERDPVDVVADQYGNPSSALDLADGLLTVLAGWEDDPTRGIGETYHLAGTGSASWFDLAGEIFATCAELGLPSPKVRPIATREWPTKAVRPYNSRLDCTKFHARFGYSAPDWRRSVETVVRRIQLEAAGAEPLQSECTPC